MPPFLRRAWRAAALLAAALAAAPAVAEPLAGPWVEFGADGRLSVRVVVAADVRTCPRVVADGAPVEARQRGAANGEFPVTVCTADVPAKTAALTIDGQALPVLPASIDRIVVIGDTGCRVEGRALQACNDPKAWPFETIAKKAAARHPALVIHVGDYYYRENACPSGNSGCAGTPHGDVWGVWQADFFAPAASLLTAAPWVMARGNHEMCRRGGRGWVRFLDPRPGLTDCKDTSPPYRLAVGGLSLLVFDSADADDFKTVPEKVAGYAAQFAELLAGAPAHSWMVTHRPVWSLGQGNLGGVPMNLTLQAAIRDRVPAGLDMVVSGHLHDFTSYSYGSGRPAQLISGTGGDTLLPLSDKPMVGVEVDGVAVQKAFALERFGYFVMERAGEGWDGTFYAAEDEAVLARCTLRGRDLDCR